MKKRFLSAILLILLVFTNMLCLSSCSDEKYEPVESTAEEKRTVMKISYDKEKYEIPYELYRAFFLQLKPIVDNGNQDVWGGLDKNTYIEKIDALISSRIADIYSVFHLCEKEGINVYSKEFDDKIYQHIKVAVEGGAIDGTVYAGFGGDYDKYLLSLKEMNMNYSVQALLIRYQLAFEKLAIHYMGNIENGADLGKMTFTKEDISAFYNDDQKSRRIICLYLDSTYFSKASAENKRENIAACKDEKAVTSYIGSINGSPIIEVIGKNTYDKFYYSELTEAAFSLNEGEASRVISLRTEDFDGYVIAYRLEKLPEFLDSSYDSVVSSYLYDRFGEIIQSTADNINNAISYTDTLKNLDRTAIRME